jgi:hypothetical protein
MRREEERRGKEKRRGEKRRDEPRREKERRKEEERRDEKRRDETRGEETKRDEKRKKEKRRDETRRDEKRRGGKNVIKSRNSHLAGAVGNNARITISNVYCCLFQIILNLILYSCNYVLFPVFVGCNSPNSSVPIVHFVAYLSPGNYADGCDLDGWMEG